MTPEPTTTQVLGCLVEVVDVAPVEHPLAVGLGAGQHARVGAGGDQDDVALELLGDGAVAVDAPRPGGRPARGSSSENRPDPAMIRTPSASSRAWMSADWATARPLTRRLTFARSSPTAASSPPSSPRTAESRTEVMAPAAAISVLDGTQSVSTLAPPMPSRSTTVTSAPSCAATSAAS